MCSARLHPMCDARTYQPAPTLVISAAALSVVPAAAFGGGALLSNALLLHG